MTNDKWKMIRPMIRCYTAYSYSKSKVGIMKRTEFRLGPLADRLNTALREAEQAGVSRRIWRKDASLWKADEASNKQIRNSLGWLTVPDEMIGVAGELIEFAELVRRRDFKHVMVCG